MKTNVELNDKARSYLIFSVEKWNIYNNGIESLTSNKFGCCTPLGSKYRQNKFLVTSFQNKLRKLVCLINHNLKI